jgi:hypothetical protein
MGGLNLKPLMPMGVLFAIIFLTWPLSMALAEKENLTIQDNMIMQNNTTMPNTMDSMPMDMLMDMLMNQNGLPSGAAANVTTNVTTNVITQNVTFNLITFVNISNISLQGPHEYIEGPVQAPNSNGLSENQSDYTKGESHFEGA